MNGGRANQISNSLCLHHIKEGLLSFPLPSLPPSLISPDDDHKKPSLPLAAAGPSPIKPFIRAKRGSSSTGGPPIHHSFMYATPTARREELVCDRATKIAIPSYPYLHTHQSLQRIVQYKLIIKIEFVLK